MPDAQVTALTTQFFVPQKDPNGSNCLMISISRSLIEFPAL